MDTFYFIVQQTMLFVIPLLIVALGGMFSEKSGIINIALEGIMIIGAFFGIVFINAMQSLGYLSQQPQLLLIFAILMSTISGMIYSGFLAFASVNMKADQTIGGTALNLFAPALVIFIARTTTNVKQVYFNQVFMIREVPILSKIPIIGDLLFKNAFITTYLGFAILIAAIIILDRTRVGLRLSACGEHPQAAESVGVNVYKMRWTGVFLSGALAGLGGLIFVVPTSVSFSGEVSGYGFLALAVMIFGQWRPKRIFFASLFFGFFKALSVTYIKLDFIMNLRIPNSAYLFRMVPFVATMIALAFTSRKSRAPKAEGIPYDSGAR